MPASVPFDRVKFSVSGTPGSGAVTVGAGVTDAANGDCLTPAQAGIADGTVVTVCWVDGHNFEIGQSTYTASDTSLSRDAAAKNWNGTTFATGNLSLTSAAIGFIVDASAELSPVLGLNKEYTTTNPAATAAGVRLSAQRKAWPSVGVTDKYGWTDDLQPALSSRGHMRVMWSGGSTVPSTVGTVAYGASGAGGSSAQDAVNTSVFTRRMRLRILTTTTTGESDGLVPGNANAFLRRGTALRVGGWRASARFGIATYVAGMRIKVGLQSSTAITLSSDPSTALASVSGIWFIKDGADTTWSLGTSNGTTFTKTATSANFPANTSAVDFYEARFQAFPDGSGFRASLHRINTGDVFDSGDLTSGNIPAQSTDLYPIFPAIGNAAVASVMALDVEALRMEWL